MEVIDKIRVSYGFGGFLARVHILVEEGSCHLIDTGMMGEVGLIAGIKGRRGIRTSPRTDPHRWGVSVHPYSELNPSAVLPAHYYKFDPVGLRRAFNNVYERHFGAGSRRVEH